jgi:hypothetical protein
MRKVIHCPMVPLGIKKVWIADNYALQTKIISVFHASAIGGHSRIHATFQRVNKLLWWKGLKQDVTSFVQ